MRIFEVELQIVAEDNITPAKLEKQVKEALKKVGINVDGVFVREASEELEDFKEEEDDF